MLEKNTCNYPLIIYPEGTRYTNKNYKVCVDYATKNGYDISKYAQLPKYKGAFALKSIVVYHMTIIYLDECGNVMKNEITKRPTKVYYYVKKYIDAPTNETEYKLWLQKIFKNTDEYYDNFNPTNAIQMKIRFTSFDYFMYTLFIGFLVAPLCRIYWF